MIIPIKPWLEQMHGSDTGHSGRRTFSLSSGLILSGDAEMDEFFDHARGPARTGGQEGICLGKEQRMEFYHEPILGAEILEAMQPVEGKQIFDGTLGGGGHSHLFLENGAHVVGCDQDAAAIEHASERLGGFGDRFLPVRGNFSQMDQILRDLGIEQVDGILLDVGVSSRQLDDPERGFSFREEARLDMRMDLRSELTAEIAVNEWEEAELVRIFREYGEERRARRVAAALVEARNEGRIETTTQLADLVASVVPKVGRKHPATQVFQAIRIAVNRELECLEEALAKAASLLAPGGVLAIISFHSLEDRLVKRFLRHTSTEMLDRPEWPEPKPNPDCVFRLPTRKAIVPGEEEREANPRSRSAKLRVAVKL